MKLVQVLGPGCPKCDKLVRNAEIAIRELGIEASVQRVTDIDAITAFDVMMTPALVIDGRVVLVGRLATPEEIKKLLA